MTPARRTLIFAGVLAAVAVVAGGLTAWVPAARQVVLGSFTRLPETYTELYFAADPVLRAGAVSARVTVVRHGTVTGEVRLQAGLAVTGGSADAGTGQVVAVPAPAEQPSTVELTLPVPAGPGPLLLSVSAPDGSGIHFRLTPPPLDP